MNETESFYVRLGSVLRKERCHRGLTRQQVAATLSFSASTIACYETGYRRVGVEELVRICTLLDVDPGDILRCVAEAQQPHIAKESS